MKKIFSISILLVLALYTYAGEVCSGDSVKVYIEKNKTQKMAINLVFENKFKLDTIQIKPKFIIDDAWYKDRFAQGYYIQTFRNKKEFNIIKDMPYALMYKNEDFIIPPCSIIKIPIPVGYKMAYDNDIDAELGVSLRLSFKYLKRNVNVTDVIFKTDYQTNYIILKEAGKNWEKPKKREVSHSVDTKKKQ